MAYFRYKIGREVNGFSDQALQSLCNYAWPGNVRELMNVIERAILLSKTDEIGIDGLPNLFNSDNSVAEAIFPGYEIGCIGMVEQNPAGSEKRNHGTG